MTIPSQNYKCIPVCRKCRDAGACDQSFALARQGDGITLEPDDEVMTRAPRDPHAGLCVLPCGCYGLPWPIVTEFGSHIEFIACDRHGWIKVPKSKREKMKAEAAAVAAGTRATVPITLFDDDDIPF